MLIILNMQGCVGLVFHGTIQRSFEGFVNCQSLNRDFRTAENMAISPSLARILEDDYSFSSSNGMGNEQDSLQEGNTSLTGEPIQDREKTMSGGGHT